MITGLQIQKQQQKQSVPFKFDLLAECKDKKLSRQNESTNFCLDTSFILISGLNVKIMSYLDRMKALTNLL